MKFLLVFLVVSLASAWGSGVFNQYRGDFNTFSVGKEFVQRQRNIIRLLNNVNMPNFYKDQEAYGNSFNFNTYRNSLKNTKQIDDFYQFYTRGALLPRGHIFSISYDLHRDQAVSLFHLFYYANDFETFYKAACWARSNVNEGMFVYALTVAVLHREDCRGFYLPPPYEIYPHFFFNNEVIEKGNRLKMQEYVYDKTLARENGIDFNDKNFIIRSNYSGWYVKVNEEQKISYFMEDIGLNSYYYYFNAYYPFWMEGRFLGLWNARRGEYFYYFYQQLLARYFMERISCNMGEIRQFSWYKPLSTGFKSNLRYTNGFNFPSRPNFFNINTERFSFVLNEVVDAEKRIRDAVFKGFVFTETGTVVTLNRPEDFNRLGNIVQGNVESVNTRFYRYIELIAKFLISNSDRPSNGYNVGPGVLEKFETAMRDPMFYQLYRRYMQYFFQYKNRLPSYTNEQFNYKGVKIQKVVIGDLFTYFDTFDSDISNAFYRRVEEVNGKENNYRFYARQNRLNHDAFDVNLEIKSDITADVVIKFFLGPKFDGRGRRIHLNDNRFNFFEMDSFVYNLKTGVNNVVRNSADFLVTVGDFEPARSFLKRIETVANTAEGFEMYKNFNGFPDRLLLPRGRRGGMVFQFYAIVVPYRTRTFKQDESVDNVPAHTASADIFKKTRSYKFDYRYFLDYAFGYPFDRFIDESQFYTPNMYFQDVYITHIDSKDARRFRDGRHYQDYAGYVNKDFNTEFNGGLNKHSEEDFSHRNFEKNVDFYKNEHGSFRSGVNSNFGI